MKRRTAISTLSVITGGSFLASSSIFSACQSSDYQLNFFSKKEVDRLRKIAGIILPATEGSPSAGDLQLAHFMDVYVADCYPPDHQKIIKEGLNQLNQKSKEILHQSFIKLSPQAAHDFLVSIDEEASNFVPSTAKKDAIHYFKLLKGLILLAYFTSEEGATQALRYEPIPGKYIGNYPLKPRDKAWAI